MHCILTNIFSDFTTIYGMCIIHHGGLCVLCAFTGLAARILAAAPEENNCSRLANFHFYYRTIVSFMLNSKLIFFYLYTLYRFIFCEYVVFY